MSPTWQSLDTANQCLSTLLQLAWTNVNGAVMLNAELCGSGHLLGGAARHHWCICSELSEVRLWPALLPQFSALARHRLLQ